MTPVDRLVRCTRRGRLVVAIVNVLLAVSAGPLAAAISAPVPKWKEAGCLIAGTDAYCETGWYSSPAVADLDGDGAFEVIAASYDVFVLAGATGATLHQAHAGHAEGGIAGSVGRTWPGVIVADLDGDGDLDIATAHQQGKVSAYDRSLQFLAGSWPVTLVDGTPISEEVRGLAAGDVDGDGHLDLIASAARTSAKNTWVLHGNGSTSSGWPQNAGQPGYAAGVYNQAVALADLDGDHKLDVIVPSDVHYVSAYDGGGTAVKTEAFPFPCASGTCRWGEVGAWVDPIAEAAGNASCGDPDTRRTNFADGAASVADLDLDGKPEIVVGGYTYDYCISYDYQQAGLYALEADRSRMNIDAGHDWTTVPDSLGAPLVVDYNVVETVDVSPVIADLDGDGVDEILFSDLSGRLHAFWLDKTEHGNWPAQVNDPKEGFFRVSGEPAVVDLDGDGKAEVIVATWTQHGSNEGGDLRIYGADGSLLASTPIPQNTTSTPGWGGALAAPTVANIDADADLEVVLMTANDGVAAFDLPNTAHARVLWGTGRGSYRRDGSAPGFRDGFEHGIAHWPAKH